MGGMKSTTRRSEKKIHKLKENSPQNQINCIAESELRVFSRSCWCVIIDVQCSFLKKNKKICVFFRLHPILSRTLSPSLAIISIKFSLLENTYAIDKNKSKTENHHAIEQFIFQVIIYSITFVPYFTPIYPSCMCTEKFVKNNVYRKSIFD